MANPDGGASGAVMRPRANTISHVDNAKIGMLANVDPSMAGLEGFNSRLVRQPSMNELPGVRGYSFRGMSTALGHHGNHVALPRLETSGLNVGISESLKTAPPYGGPRGPIDMEHLWLGPESTVNPAQLHFSNSPGSLAFETPVSPFDQSFAAMPAAYAALDEEGNFSWFGGFENQMSLSNVNEQAIDGSSPSVISTGSHSGLSEPMLDCSKTSTHPMSLWPTPMLPQAPITPNLPMDWSMPAYQGSFAPGQLSPKSLQMQMGGADQYFPSSLSFNTQTPLSKFQGRCYPYFHPPMILEPDTETPGNSIDSVSSSNRQSSMTSFSADLITDATRQALLAAFAVSPAHGHSHLTVSMGSVDSSSSAAFGGSLHGVGNAFLPSTPHLQRYVAAYIKYFHPHLPFLHIPSLSFHCLAQINDTQASNHSYGLAQSESPNSGRSLILAMAAIGALYEFDNSAANDLFEMAKKLIEGHVENNNAADVSEAVKGPCGTMESSNQASHLWLIQALALIVIYGHHCGEPVPPEVASSQCFTLVRLARESQLAGIPSENFSGDLKQMSPINQYSLGHEPQICGGEQGSGTWGSEVGKDSFACQIEWLEWKSQEERKRTFYVVFIMSSLLISGHIHMPTLTNAEIRLALPCDEDMWAADSAESWMALGGKVVADIKETPFAAALSFLLTANESLQEQQPQHHNFKEELNSNLSAGGVLESQFKPGTFGCLVLLHALHSYTWETRQRHMGRHWTTRETQQMLGRMEPALKAWEAMWNDNPNRSLDRSHLSGCGLLWKDCIPILDMAYLGLYVNLGRAKEAFWRRDYDGVADELARGPALVPVVSNSSSPSVPAGDHIDGGLSTPASNYVKTEPPDCAIQFEQQAVQPHQQYSNRERHLRQAACCAVNSLAMSIQMGRTVLDCDSRELSIQSAASVYDATQILAEWVSTVQERVGRYLGILGIGFIDFCQVPVGFLDEEDLRLLDKIKQLIEILEGRLASYGFTNSWLSNHISNDLVGMEGYNLGSKLLAMSAFLLKMSPVWPGESSILRITK